MLEYDPRFRPGAAEVEHACWELHRNLPGEPERLRHWAERIIPPLLERFPEDESDPLVGTSISESGQLSGLGERPAAVEASAPSPVHEEPAPDPEESWELDDPEPQPDPEPTPEPPVAVRKLPATWLLVAGGAAVLLALIGGVAGVAGLAGAGGILLLGGGADDAPAPTTVSVVHVPVPAATGPQARPPVQPPSAAPAPVEDDDTAEPGPSLDAPGRLSVDGDAREVYLLSDTRARFDPGAVPRGTYTVMAVFDDAGPERIRTVYVNPGSRLALRCEREARSCTVQR